MKTTYVLLIKSTRNFVKNHLGELLSFDNEYNAEIYRNQFLNPALLEVYPFSLHD